MRFSSCSSTSAQRPFRPVPGRLSAAMTLPSIGYRRAPLLASERELPLATVMAAMTGLFAAAAAYGANSFAVGEIDVAWMIAGVVHGTLAHQPFSGALHYGSNFSFGYYALLYLLPPEVRADPASLARVVNAIGLASVTAALPLAWRTLPRLMVPPTQTGAGSILAFVAGYYDVRSLPRGMALLAIGAGFATCLAAAAALSRTRAVRLDRRQMLLLGALIVPSALAWLPNPQPVRHFFVLALGIAVFLAWRLTPSLAHPRALWLAAAAVIVGNQVLAELAYPLVVRHYDWAHPASEAR